MSTTSRTEAAVAVLGEVTSSGLAGDQAGRHAARSLVAEVKRQPHVGLCRGQIVAHAVEDAATLVAGDAIAAPESSKTTEIRAPTVLPG
jgi:aspartate oxidase